jgi:hypothetical protein
VPLSLWVKTSKEGHNSADPGVAMGSHEPEAKHAGTFTFDIA